MYALLLVVLVILPVGGWLLSRRLRTANVQVRDQQSQLSNTLVDSLTAPQEVQLLGAGQRRSAAFGARLRELARAQVRAVIQSETSNQFQAAVPQILVAGFIVWAIFLVAQQGSEARVAAIQAVLAIYLFVPRVVQPIQEMIQFYSTLNIAWPSVEKVGMLLEERNEVQDTGTKTVSDLKHSDVALDNVVYRPKPDLLVLDNVSFKFEPGTITALVGRSGSGKTSILRLISRLSDPESGRVVIGGIDAREFRLADLRAASATVSQFPLFIEADVRENLRLGVPNATDAEMETACREADLWLALQRLSPEDPLATAVTRQAGKGGLAGGERRRLAIARALLAKPHILLLDEPSTGIDVMSVGKIADAIRAKPGQTMILVEHNIPLVRSLAHQVVCLQNGRFTDIGTPEELLARPTLFRELWEEWQRLTDTTEMEVHGTVPVRSVEGAAAARGATAGGAKGSAPAGGARAARPGDDSAPRPSEGGAMRPAESGSARPQGAPGHSAARAARAAPPSDGKGAPRAAAPAGKAPAGDRNG
jgi:ATP-binding cassette subfamily B protein